MPELERLLRDAAARARRGFEIEAWVGRAARADPVPTPPRSRLGQDAFERALWRSARSCSARAERFRSCPRSPTGGSRTIVTGFDLPEGNLHSPNERLLVEHFPLGVAAARELFLALASL